jgi:hypothetical protein
MACPTHPAATEYWATNALFVLATDCTTPVVDDPPPHAIRDPNALDTTNKSTTLDAAKRAILFISLCWD